ncbi:hypothetical protein KR067_003797, partial [Drosophila pandora]
FSASAMELPLCLLLVASGGVCLARGQFLKESTITSIYMAREAFYGEVIEEPYMMALYFRSRTRGWFCVGSIIDSRWIITAAHCTNDSRTVQLERLLPRLRYTLTQRSIFQHPDFNERLNHDVALIRVPQLRLSPLLNRVKLPALSSKSNLFVGARTWGFEWPRDKGTKATERVVMTNEDCIAAGYSRKVVIASTLCVDVPAGESACIVDDGGALLHNPSKILIGVVSFASVGGCLAGEPEGFSRITSYMTWISQVTGIER